MLSSTFKMDPASCCKVHQALLSFFFLAPIKFDNTLLPWNMYYFLIEFNSTQQMSICYRPQWLPKMGFESNGMLFFEKPLENFSVAAYFILHTNLILDLIVRFQREWRWMLRRCLECCKNKTVAWQICFQGTKTNFLKTLL